MQIFPKGEHEEVKDYISLFVNLHDPPENLSMTVNGKFSLLNSSNEVLSEGNPWNSVEFGFDEYNGWGYPKMALIESLFEANSNNLPDDELHVKCELVYETAKRCSTTQHLPQMPINSNPEIDSLVDNFQQLMDSKPESDVAFVVGGVYFACHKALLASKSPVFSNIFLNDSISKTFDIDDIEPQVFAEVLRYIYTNQVENLNELARKILVVSDNYKLHELKAKCEASLIADINLENCAHLLILSDRYSADNLKNRILDFIRLHYAKVMVKSAWKRMLNIANKQLLNDISEALNRQ